MLDGLTTFNDFDRAADAALQFLRSRVPGATWVLTRFQGEQLLILQSTGAADPAGVQCGDRFPLKDTLCYRMVQSGQVFIAPDLAGHPLSADAEVPRSLGLRSYLGVPLLTDGTVFGTICGFSKQVQSPSVLDEASLLALVGKLLSTILCQELAAGRAAREVERRKAQALRDGFCGVYNRRGLDELIVAEEQRCRRYGHPACALVIDLNGLKLVNDSLGHTAGDQLIAATAEALDCVSRENDIVARTGGDEFVLIAVECDEAGGLRMVQRVRDRLRQAGVSAAVGMSFRDSNSTLQQAIERADALMYEDKRRFKNSRASA